MVRRSRTRRGEERMFGALDSAYRTLAGGIVLQPLRPITMQRLGRQVDERHHPGWLMGICWSGLCCAVSLCWERPDLVQGRRVSLQRSSLLYVAGEQHALPATSI